MSQLTDKQYFIYKFFHFNIAGVEFLTTNTYQASIVGFKKYLDLSCEQSFELIKKSVTICRRAITESNSGEYINVLIK